MSIEVWKILASQGAGLLALGIVVYFLYKLAVKLGSPFIAAQNAQAAAMQNQAECMSKMKDSVSEFVGRDNNDHREILLSLKVVIKEVQQQGDDLKELAELIRGQRQDMNQTAGQPVAIARR